MFTQNLPYFTNPYLQRGNLPTSDMRLGSRRSHANSISQTPLQGTGANGLATTAAFDPFVTAPTPLPGSGVGTVSGNPYSPDTAAVAATAAALNGAAFFANQSGFQQPVSQFSICLLAWSNALQVQYHLYAPIGPHNQNTLGYQRNIHDLFLPNDFREELQKKAAATLQMLPSAVISVHLMYDRQLTPD